MVPHIYSNLWAFLPKPRGDLHTARAGAHDEGPSLPACLWSDPSNGVSPSLGGEGKLPLVFTIFYSIALCWAWFSSMISQSDLNSLPLLKSKR